MIRDGIRLWTIREARDGCQQPDANPHQASTSYPNDWRDVNRVCESSTYSSVSLVVSCKPLIWHRTSFNKPLVESFEFYIADSTSPAAPLKFRCWGDLAVHVAARLEPGAVVLLDSYRIGTFGKALKEQVGCWDRECTELHVLRAAQGGRLMFDAHRHDYLARAIEGSVAPLLCSCPPASLPAALHSNPALNPEVSDTAPQPANQPADGMKNSPVDRSKGPAISRYF
jgi:hypothetical protein